MRLEVNWNGEPFYEHFHKQIHSGNLKFLVIFFYLEMSLHQQQLITYKKINNRININKYGNKIYSINFFLLI